FVPEFHIRGENNIPAYFSSLLLAGASLLLWIISRIRQAAGGKYSYHWLILSIVFLFLSLDETASIHERLNRPINRVLELDLTYHFTSVVSQRYPTRSE
ncbi:MAG: hypothetical protein ACREQV_02305, partial [Candidatus Binatia bacterium]